MSTLRERWYKTWPMILMACGIIIFGCSIAYWGSRQPSKPPPNTQPTTTTQTVPVIPSRVPITKIEQAKAEKPGTIPDNGATPVNADVPPPVPEEFVMPEDGFGGQVTFAKQETFTPWTPAQSVIYAAGQVNHPDKSYFALCAHFVSWVYGFQGYGMTSAKTGGQSVPSSKRRKMVAVPPAGAIVYFIGNDTGPYGHVILSAGDGTYYSNDIVSRGRISRVKISLFAQKWGMRPSFYTNAYLPWSFGRNPNPAPKIAPPAPPKPVPNAQNVGARVNGGKVLTAGQGMFSGNGRYRAIMQGDGNYVVYDRNRAIWSSRTNRHPGSILAMQGDGNLVVYKGRKPLWNSRTYRHPGAWVVMQNDGNLVIYRKGAGIASRALWSSKFGRRY